MSFFTLCLKIYKDDDKYTSHLKEVYPKDVLKRNFLNTQCLDTQR